MAKMKEIEVADLSAFLNSYRNHFPNAKPDENGFAGYFSDILFRGQSRAAWPLETSLERYGLSDCKVSDYIDYVFRVSSEYASYSGRTFEREGELRQLSTWMSISKHLRLLNLIVELRHFGFPSPLLDWTTSPYIAAYFAYRDAQEDEPVAIFALQENVGEGKGGWAADPQIRGIGPYIETTDRHHIQQAQYTICTRLSEGEEVFSKHGDGFAISAEDQDILVKFILPASLRADVLDSLQAMNINDYTLFRNTESLCRHLAYKHIRRRL